MEALATAGSVLIWAIIVIIALSILTTIGFWAFILLTARSEAKAKRTALERRVTIVNRAPNPSRHWADHK